MLEIVARPNPVEEHCQLVLKSAWEAVSSIMADFDEWMHFRTAVRLRDVSSFEDLTKIEDQFLLLAETEQVDELLQWRSMLMSKLYELEVQKLVDEHLENFKLDANQEQAQARVSYQRKEQVDDVVRSVVNIEETADEIGEHQAQTNHHTDNKLEEFEKVIASLDFRIISMDSRMHSMDSKMNTVAGNVKSSQTSLETTVLHHLTEHQLQLASDLGFVKLQLAELVDHLKQAGDAKKGEGGQGGRPGE
ncbi:hypothetical protein F511_36202 [Dorcoceras hygrometricum]|uniref:Uncharacterized protein n=1 Tax=Dorcoceras hygrometricum TaxID=472368 RepID=A0A2Z7D7R2_9LAMI|nr:hypothetical protein F511_36202 [Dorcoceras hygrometricum]